jgi:hypothetical protein
LETFPDHSHKQNHRKSAGHCQVGSGNDLQIGAKEKDEGKFVLVI